MNNLEKSLSLSFSFLGKHVALGGVIKDTNRPIEWPVVLAAHQRKIFDF